MLMSGEMESKQDEPFYNNNKLAANMCCEPGALFSEVNVLSVSEQEINIWSSRLLSGPQACVYT